MEEKIKNLDWDYNAIKNIGKGKDWQKTTDDVFDEPTLRNIQQLINRGIIATVENIIASGKEANVFRAKTVNGRNRAMKIYRLNTATFRKLDKYIEGDPRFNNIGNNHRDRVFTWAQKEYKNLHAMRAAGAIVPEPFHAYKNIIVMQYLGWRYRPYPTLKELPPENPSEFLSTLLKSIHAYQNAKFSHGDLSEYNILNVRDRPVIIDVGQAVPKGHPLYEKLNIRDMKNIYSYWKKQIKGIKKENFGL